MWELGLPDRIEGASFLPHSTTTIELQVAGGRISCTIRYWSELSVSRWVFLKCGKGKYVTVEERVGDDGDDGGKAQNIY